MTDILKIGLVAIDADGRLLVVRKVGGETFILPGGKKEGDETDQQALKREIGEELGTTTAGPLTYMGTFGAIAADMPDRTVMVRAYRGALAGEPIAQAEIAEARWIDPAAPGVKLAPTIEYGILPALRRQDRG